MEYNKIISVTGLGGLYELIGSKADGAIVRSLEDNTTKFVSSRIHQFSHLESIEVFTVKEDNVNLTEIFSAIKNSSEAIPDYKDVPAVKKYFEKIYPDMDFDRVYTSDMKKMVRWYNILTKNNIDFSRPEAISEEPVAEETNVTEVAEEVPAKASVKKAKAAKKKENADEETTEEKPKKKAAPKKKKTEE